MLIHATVPVDLLVAGGMLGHLKKKKKMDVVMFQSTDAQPNMLTDGSDA